MAEEENALFHKYPTMYTMAFVRYSKQSDIPEKVLKAIEVKLDEIITGE